MNRMKLFIDDPFNPKLRTHKLSGKLSGQWAASIDDEYRLSGKVLHVCMTWYGLSRYMSLILKHGWIHYTEGVKYEML